MQALFKIGAQLPLWLLRGLGHAFGWLTWMASARYRRSFRANWVRGLQVLQAKGLLRSEPSMAGAIGRAGWLVTELPKIWCDPKAEEAMPMEGLAHLDAVLAGGHGALVLTPHLGAFELAPRVIGRHHPMTVLYRPSRQPAVERLLQALRPTPVVKTAPATAGGVRQLMRSLRAGETVGMLPDQVPGQGDGAWAPFFGEPAYTMTLPLRLAQATGAGIVWASALRTSGGWRLVLEPWVPAGGLSPEADLGPWLVALNEKVEGLIARAPQDYLWAYNRFKVPAGRPSAHA